jgi:two-component system phosphate regulon sensor histidine kinase PhoR
LLNLLTNAHKYSPVDRPIAVRAFADRNNVHVAVEDHGIGIARNEHHRVFEKFYRSDDRLSRSIEGSGLGLAIVQHVVLAHRGKVTLRSAPGRGSTFTISLPIALQAADARVAYSSRPVRGASEEA